MARERERTGRSPLVLLSLCLSLLAVALSAMALLMVYDQTRPLGKSRDSLEIRRVDWDWERGIGRMEKHLDQLRESLLESGEKGREAATRQMRSVGSEMEAWVRAAEPRLQETIDRMSRQAEDLRLAVSERSEQAAEKLGALRESLHELRKRVGQKQTEVAPEE